MKLKKNFRIFGIHNETFFMSYMSTFHLYNDRVDIFLTDGKVLTLHFNADSGKAFFRYKINTISGIKHPGLYIGYDNLGIHYIAHNHYLNGKPALVTWDDFKQGQVIYLYPEYATNPPLMVVKKALNGIQTGEKYTAVLFNCQDFVNEAISDKRRSPAIENLFKGFALLGLLYWGLSVSKDK